MTRRVQVPAPRRSTRAANSKERNELVLQAWRAREHALASYSGFKVGAALRAADGTVFNGCNVENSTYGLTLCAERVALIKALSEGFRAFTEIAVVAESATPTPPCGSCRQFLWEFCGDIDIVLANSRKTYRQVKLSGLFPEPFEDAYFRKSHAPDETP